MKSRVYFIEASLSEKPQSIETKLKILMERSRVFEGIKKGSFACVKLTFGEKGNKGYVSPRYVRVIVEQLKKIGARPFLCDTNTLYKGSRQNAIDHMDLAAKHGFTYEAVGAPVIIGDGLFGEDYSEVRIDKKYVSIAKVARIARDADALVGIAHFTGHMLTGFGAAIKNLGMGLANRAGKLTQHSSVSPRVVSDKCTGCGRCIAVCPANAIAFKRNPAKPKGRLPVAQINTKSCIGCGDCIVACRFDAISIFWSKSSRILQEKMAEYAYAALRDKGEQVGFITFLTRVTKECDCMAKDDPAIVNDIGILASRDPLAIDKAGVDLILSRKKTDPFEAAHPKTDWQYQLRHASAIGLGSPDYELVKAT